MYDAVAKVPYKKIDLFTGYVDDLSDEASYWAWNNTLHLGSTAGAELTHPLLCRLA